MLIAGIDEVGRGPLAGPVVAAAAVFEKGYTNPLFVDSKKLTPARRAALLPIIMQDAVSYSIIAVGHQRIEEHNIRGATKLAMELALKRVKADHVLIDGNMSIDTLIPQTTVVKGDSKHVEIAAASILAKEYRDNLMKTLDEKYPGFSFSKHAGYPTKAHKEAISLHGPSRIHRRSFRGVKEYWGQ